MAMKSKFGLKDSVRKIGESKIGVVEEIRPADSPGEETKYFVEFDRDFSTRRYIDESSLELLAKAEGPVGEPGLVPDRPLMD